MAWNKSEWGRKARKEAAKHHRNDKSDLIRALEELEAPVITDEELIEELEIIGEMTGCELTAQEKIAIINGEWRKQ